MQTLFSTEGVLEKDRFRLWRDVCEDRLVPMAQDRLNDDPFHATIEGASIGGLVFTKFALRNLRAATTPRTLRHENHKTDHLFMSIVLSGQVRADQYDRSSTDRVGDFSIRDTNTPWTIEHGGYSEVLAIGIPRERLEGALGSARLFAGVTVGGDLPTATLTRSFLGNLLSLGDRLTPQVAESMVSTGLDLIVASLAERLAREAQRPVQDSVVVQRARAYLEAHLHDPTLDPPRLAAAAGVSLRRLQALFRAQDRHIADWIWHRRLEAAAKRLADPGCLHMPLGTVAYGCGFLSQSHFSRRFKERYGLSPRDYRVRALAPGAAASPER
ncbi:helix-turn-helix domain-containing protein [Methylobacterium sp.]|uniref:helix-turn-helix domain-containing protein n=2 Tax=Methylobacterium TaxID=407 RepID=UPI0004943DC7|nr:helix-turn-helix domain-containing protein [Methylobacterium sp.]RUP20178.1 MAG: helix-turn-helix domain-containing protein [Methylobacterium sp.]